jgi:hypothetical protein
MYGDMTDEEIELVYRHKGDYKGWSCIYTGCGSLIFKKPKKYGDEIRAHRGWEVKSWIPECWKEIKARIDAIEN